MSSTVKSCITAKVAVEEIGRTVGLTLRAKRLRLLNEIRQWVYAQQRQVGLDLSKTLCVEIQTFCDDCKACSKTYKGFRLPQNTFSVEAVSIGNQHIDVYSHWRLPYDGIAGAPCSSSVSLIDGKYRATERDIACGRASTLRWTNEGEKCVDVTVAGITASGSEKKSYSLLPNAPLITGDAFFQVDEVSFPLGNEGIVTLSDDGEVPRVLARYQPGDTVPKFREFRLIGDSRCIEQLVVIANCAYADITDLNEVVEFGNKLVWQWLAKYIQLMGKDDPDANDRANLNVFLKTAVDLMLQESAVEENENTVLVFKRESVGAGSSLNSEHRGCW